MASRDLTIVLLVILGIFVLMPVLGMSLGGFGMMGGHGMWGRGMMGYGGGWGLFVWLLILAGIVLIALGVFRKDARPESPLDVLKRRLARGEITKEQFEELKQALQ